MPTINNGEISIFYTTDGNDTNPPLVLLHWFMGSHQTWYDIGWVRELSDYFHLILVDHRGYGNSSKPHEPEAYQLKHHVEDLELLLNHLNIDQAHFMGYSMGGRIAFAIASFAPQRIKSLVIGGMHPFSSDLIPTNLDKRIELLKQGMEITLRTYGIGPKAVFDRMLNNDAKALLADTIQTKSWEGFEEELRDFDKPVLLFVGSDDGFYDGVREVSNLLSNASFVSFTGENHRTAFLKRQLLLPHLKRFYNI